MLDFARRVGFEARLCQPYRAQTKGKVQVRAMWPRSVSRRADLNRQGLEWCDVVANARVHGTTHRVPWEMLAEERPHLGKLPDRATLAPYLREDRKVSRDGFVSWEGSRYGVHWKSGPRCRWGSARARWRSGLVMSASGASPGATPKERFILPASGRACPGVTTGLGKRQWRCRFPRARWNAALWKCTRVAGGVA